MEPILYKIRLLRKMYGYPQEYMAMRLSMTQSAYSKRESGLVEPTFGHLEKIAALFDLTLVDLLTKKPDELVQNALARCSL